MRIAMLLISAMLFATSHAHGQGGPTQSWSDLFPRSSAPDLPNASSGPAKPPAFERAIPYYNVDQVCERAMGLLESNSYMLRNACIDGEQDAYDKLKSRWGAFPFNVVDGCLKTMAYMGDSYTLLEACISAEMQERASPRAFRR